MSEYTKGPWFVGRRVSIRDENLKIETLTICRNTNPGTEDIAYVAGNKDIREADAKLIAAAPDLLEALEEILQAATEYDFYDAGSLAKAVGEIRTLSKQAIAKATE